MSIKTYQELGDALRVAGVRWESLSQAGFQQYGLTSWQSPHEIRDGLERAGFTVESVESDPDQNMLTLAWFNLP